MAAEEQLSGAAASGASSGVASSLLAIGGNILTSLLGGQINRQLQKERNDLAVEQWRRENEYNLPIHQIQRLRDAGLNPNLIYENGASGLLSATSPEMSAAHFGGFPAVDPLTLAQIRKLDSETELNRANSNQLNTLLPFNVQNLEANNDVLRNQAKLLDAQQQDVYKQWTFKESQSAINQQVADSQCALWNKMIDSMQVDNELKEQLKLKTAEEYRQLQANASLIRQGIISRNSLNDAEARRFDQLNELIDSEKALNEANASSANASAGLSSAKSKTEDLARQFIVEYQKNASTLQSAQANYYRDLQRHPSKYQMSYHYSAN